MEIKKGYVQSVIQPEHYVLGSSSLPQVVLRPSGNWNDYSVEKESQLKQFETYNCTGFNTLGALETLEYFLTGVRPEYSDRWLGIVAGTKPPGNDPQTVCEAIRKNGLIPESMLPFSEDLQNVDEYYSFKGADEAKCRAEGQRWLATHEFGHEWVLDGTESNWQERMELGLTYSILCGAVYAWQLDDKGFYIRAGNPDVHWTRITNAIPNIDWDCQDSYAPFTKQLDWNFGFSFVKRFHLALKPQQTPEVKIGLMTWLISLLKKLIWMRTSQT